MNTKDEAQKTAHAEYIQYLAVYRVYMEDSPKLTIVYDDDIEEIRDWAKRHDYNLIITA